MATTAIVFVLRLLGSIPAISDDREYLMIFLYTNVMASIKLVRRNMCTEFFEMLGYLFIPWGGISECLVSSDSISIVSASQDGSSKVEVNLKKFTISENAQTLL